MSHKPWLEKRESESGSATQPEHQHSSPLLQTMGQGCCTYRVSGASAEVAMLGFGQGLEQ